MPSIFSLTPALVSKHTEHHTGYPRCASPVSGSHRRWIIRCRVLQRGWHVWIWSQCRNYKFDISLNIKRTGAQWWGGSQPSMFFLFLAKLYHLIVYSEHRYNIWIRNSWYEYGWHSPYAPGVMQHFNPWCFIKQRWPTIRRVSVIVCADKCGHTAYVWYHWWSWSERLTIGYIFLHTMYQFLLFIWCDGYLWYVH